jgi:hypothetical protein
VCDDYLAAADHRLIEILRGGGTPPDPDRVSRALAEWWRQVHATPMPTLADVFAAIADGYRGGRRHELLDEPATTSLPVYPQIRAAMTWPSGDVDPDAMPPESAHSHGGAE